MAGSNEKGQWTTDEKDDCPVCKQQFRRKIESWMKFECKDCGRDLCKENDTNLYSGQCPECFSKEWDLKHPPKEEKENVVPEKMESENTVEEPRDSTPKKVGLDKWF